MLSLLFVTTFAAGGVASAQATLSSPVQNGLGPGTAQLTSNALADPVTTTTSPPTTTTAPPAPVQALAPTPASPAAAAPAPAPTPTPAPAATPLEAPAPAPAPAPVVPALPAIGHASASGCAAALAYLQAYAAPGFAFACPGYAEGHQAMTCLGDTPQYPNACPNGPTIAISDACPAAYMNESANSWYLSGQLSTEQAKFGVSYGSIDPFGAC